jgi:uncharacterized glyoxalase superfamily protein PhnB
MTFKPTTCPQFFVYLTVRDCEAAIELYRKAFNFEVTSSVPGENGKIQHAELKYGEMVIMMAPEGAWGNATHKAPITLGTSPSSTFYMYVENVDEFYKHAIEGGAKSLGEPEEGFWGDRFCRVSDADGYEWMFATMVRDHKV